MIDRRTFSATLLAVAAGSLTGIRTVAKAATNAPATTGPRNVVLIHGAYADGSSWSGVINRLQASGMNVTAVQNSLNSFADDVATTRRVLAMQDGPTILVAHSYGGMVLSETGVDPKISALVYVAARAPDAGEDYAALAASYPAAPASAGLVTRGDFSQLSESAFLNDFANGVDPKRAQEGPIADRGDALFRRSDDDGSLEIKTFVVRRFKAR